MCSAPDHTYHELITFRPPSIGETDGGLIRMFLIFWDFSFTKVITQSCLFSPFILLKCFVLHMQCIVNCCLWECVKCRWVLLLPRKFILLTSRAESTSSYLVVMASGGYASRVPVLYPVGNFILDISTQQGILAFYFVSFHLWFSVSFFLFRFLDQVMLLTLFRNY